MAASFINPNNVLICANNGNSVATRPHFDAKKPPAWTVKSLENTHSKNNNGVKVPENFGAEDLKFDSSIVDSFVPPDLVLGSKLSSPAIVEQKRQDAFTKAFKSFCKPFNNFHLENNFLGNKDKTVLVEGKRYENASAFLETIKTHSKVNVADLDPEMQNELVLLYKFVLAEKDKKFKIFCGVRTPEHNAANRKKAIKAGRPAAVAENSLHKKDDENNKGGFAVDILTKRPRDKFVFGDVWKKDFNHVYGMDFKDYPESWHLGWKFNKKRPPSNKQNIEKHKTKLNS